MVNVFVAVAVAVAVAVVEWLGISDEGGVQGAAVVGASGTGLKELLDEGRLLLLQLGDAFTLLSYLLGTTRVTDRHKSVETVGEKRGGVKR